MWGKHHRLIQLLGDFVVLFLLLHGGRAQERVVIRYHLSGGESVERVELKSIDSESNWDKVGMVVVVHIGSTRNVGSGVYRLIICGSELMSIAIDTTLNDTNDRETHLDKNNRASHHFY